jgi:hypothetical protein
MGQAGEYLVAAEITAKGYVCLTTPPKVKYDLVADVKASKTGKLVYEFTLKKDRKKGSEYHKDDIDGFALVAFNQRQIAFIPRTDKTSINFRVHGVSYGQQASAKYMDNPAYSFEAFIEQVLKNRMIANEK